MGTLDPEPLARKEARHSPLAPLSDYLLVDDPAILSVIEREVVSAPVRKQEKMTHAQAPTKRRGGPLGPPRWS